MSKNGRNSAQHYQWRKKVKERDKYKCQICGIEDGTSLHAHHIIPWKTDESKRFDITNGITYCKSCHKKTEGVIPAGWNKGLKRSEQWCQNLSQSLKGRKAWNKGIKGLKVSSETQFKKGNKPWNHGIKKELPKFRFCKKCNVEKKITDFTPQQKGKFYSHTCKICRNKGNFLWQGQEIA